VRLIRRFSVRSGIALAAAVALAGIAMAVAAGARTAQPTATQGSSAAAIADNLNNLRASLAGTTAVRVASSDYISLDWQVTGSITAYGYSYVGYDRLVAFGKDGKTVLPYIAKSWTQTPKTRPRTITFTLRRDAKCSDGTPITPLVVLNSFKRYIQVPKTTGNLLLGFFGKGPYHISANMKKWTFTWHTETPYASMIYGFAQVGIVCPAGLAAVKNDSHALEKMQYGSGPYKMVSAAPSDKVIWKKNPAWKWGPPGSDIKKMPDNLIYQYVPNATTAANILLTGAADWGGVSGPDVDRLLATPSLVKKKLTSYYSYDLLFNQHNGRITQDEKVREAMMTAFNPKSFVQVAFRGRAAYAPSLVYPTLPCFDKKTLTLTPKYSIAKARAILQSDGYSPNSNGLMAKNGKVLKVQLLAGSDTIGAGGEYLASQFKQAGIDVDLVNLAGNLYGPRYLSENWDAVVAANVQYAPIPSVGVRNVSGPAPPAGLNRGLIGGGNQAWERAALYAQQSLDCSWLNKFQELSLTQHNLAPVGFPVSYTFGGKKWNVPVNGVFAEPAWITKTG
jgi:peptide/nickel transport system substrate-binding protein